VQSLLVALPGENGNDLTYESATDELSGLIRDAVKMQLISDVPLGTFCSGGLDSSLITAFAARLTEKPINTFSVGFYEDIMMRHPMPGSCRGSMVQITTKSKSAP